MAINLLVDHGSLAGRTDPDHPAGAIAFTATDRLLCRATAGAGAGEEGVLTTQGRLLLAEATAAGQRGVLNLGTMAVETATDYLAKAGNLTGLADASAARNNLGLATAILDATANRRTGWIAGLNLEYVDAATMRVKKGGCRDSADALDLVLPADTDAAITTEADLAAGTSGLDVKTLTGTAATTNADANVVGTNTLFLSEFGTRSVGTCVFTNASATVTGIGFSKGIKSYDLIGPAAGPFQMVVSIESDTSLTVASAFGADSTETGYLIERPICTINGQTKYVKTITSNTAMTCGNAYAGDSAGDTIYAGTEIASCWYYLYIGTNGTNTIIFISTQRTTPYIGGTTGMRRLGSVRNNVASNFAEDIWTGEGRRRHAFTYPGAWLSGGVGVVTTQFSSEPAISPMAVEAECGVSIDEILVDVAGRVTVWLDSLVHYDGEVTPVVSASAYAAAAVEGCSRSQGLVIPCETMKYIILLPVAASITGGSISITILGWWEDI